MKQDGPVAAEAYTVNQAKSHQEKATSLGAASVPVRNLLESEFMLNFFNHYCYNHVKHSIKHSGLTFFFFFQKTPSFKKTKLNKQKSRHKNVFFFLRSNNYNTLERVMEEAFHAVNKNSK